MGFSSFSSYGTQVSGLARRVTLGSVVATTKRIQSFTTTGASTFVMPFDVIEIELLIIGGGGGGGASIGGGGGAGGFGYFSNYSVISNNTYNIVVGVGGLGDSTVQKGPSGQKGGNSSFNDIIRYGGGAGKEFQGSTTSLNDGASGGGGSYQNDAGGSSILGQGNDGGFYYFNNPQYFGGGGGGASAKGNRINLTTSDINNYNGGDGIESSISGVSTFYSGGGGGGALRSSIPYTNNGGKGGGGQGEGSVGGGYYIRPILSMDGAPNTGGGGGGRAEDGNANITRGGNGGSGIVIISYMSAS